MQIPCDVVQEYEVPPGVTAVRIEAESSGAGRHSGSAVTLQIPPGAILRLRLACLPAQGAVRGSQPPRPAIRDPIGTPQTLRGDCLKTTVF
jgi:hypothetical protein